MVCYSWDTQPVSTSFNLLLFLTENKPFSSTVTFTRLELTLSEILIMEATDAVSTAQSFRSAEGCSSYSVPSNAIRLVNIYNTNYKYIYIFKPTVYLKMQA